MNTARAYTRLMLSAVATRAERQRLVLESERRSDVTDRPRPRANRLVLRHLDLRSSVAPDRAFYQAGGRAAGVSPWRRMTSAIRARSGGPPAEAVKTAATSWKYSGPSNPGVMTQSTFAST